MRDDRTPPWMPGNPHCLTRPSAMYWPMFSFFRGEGGRWVRMHEDLLENRDQLWIDVGGHYHAWPDGGTAFWKPLARHRDRRHYDDRHRRRDVRCLGHPCV